MKHIPIFLIVLLSVSCTLTQPLQVLDKSYKGYMPFEPLRVNNVEMFDGTQFVTKPWASLTDSAIRMLLPNQSSQVSMRTTDSKGGISYLTGSVTDEAGTYEVFMDYMKYRVEDVPQGNVIIGNGRVGIGLRVKATVITNKAKLNISSLTSLAVEASNNNLTGLLTIDIIGIDSKDITNYIPLTAKLDETSIQNALQAIATIKSKIWDDNVKITPHLIAINQNKDSVMKEIRDKIVGIGVYDFTKASETILNYWKPAKSEINKEHEAKIKAWMEANCLQDTSITYLINTAEMEQKRQKLIMDLNLCYYENRNN